MKQKRASRSLHSEQCHGGKVKESEDSEENLVFQVLPHAPYPTGHSVLLIPPAQHFRRGPSTPPHPLQLPFKMSSPPA